MTSLHRPNGRGGGSAWFPKDRCRSVGSGVEAVDCAKFRRGVAHDGGECVAGAVDERKFEIVGGGRDQDVTELGPDNFLTSQAMPSGWIGLSGCPGERWRSARAKRSCKRPGWSSTSSMA